jgi:hypothetical protein
MRCQNNQFQYGDSLSVCTERCRLDNCSYISSAWQRQVCPFGEQTRDPECLNTVLPTRRCPDAHLTPLGDPDPACANETDPTPACPDAWNTRLSFCTPAAQEDFCEPRAGCHLFDPDPNCNEQALTPCHAIYSNDQTDYDEDAIGDKCDWVNSGAPRFRSLGGGLVQTDPDNPAAPPVYYQPGDRYEIRFHAWGGEPNLDTGVTPPVVDYGSVERTNTQVGACHCDKNAYGEWMEVCYEKCPLDSDFAIVGNEAIRPWVPINGSGCEDLPFTGSPGAEAAYNAHQICSNRELEFTRDEQSNLVSVQWDWRNMRQRGNFNVVVGDTYAEDANPPWKRTTRIRLAWPMYGQPIELQDVEPPVSNEAAFTPNQGLRASDLRQALQPRIPNGRIPRHFPVEPQGWIGPAPVARSGYALVTDPLINEAALITFGPESPVATSVRTLQMDGAVDLSAQWAGAGGPVDGALLGEAPGEVNGVFLYQGPASPARLLVGVDAPQDTTVILSSGQSLWATAAPQAYDARLMYLPDARELLLLGATSAGGARDHVWRLRLETGLWEGPVTPPALQDRRAYSADFDPVSRKVVIFGGTLSSADRPTTGGDLPPEAASSDVLLLDPLGLGVTEMPVANGTPTGLARANHGSRLVPRRRVLYVSGGLREGQILADTWRLNLLTRRWEPVGGGGPAALEPYVHFDPVGHTLWLGDLTGAQPRAGLDLWVRDESGPWLETETLRPAAPNAFPIDDVLVSGRAAPYLWSPEPGTPLPGAYLLARLQSAHAGTEVSLHELGHPETSQGQLAVTGEQEAGLLCQTGSRCLTQVTAPSSLRPGGLVPYRIDLVQATPQLEVRSAPRGWSSDLVLHHDRLVVVGPGGLRLLDAATLARVGRIRGRGLNGATGVTPCGAHLCVSRTGLKGLAVVDVSDPAQPRVKSRIFTAGLGWDVAARGARAYVAHGLGGVGIYDVSDPASPVQVGSICTGGAVRSVSTRGSLLAVAKVGGQVQLYELQGGPTLVSTLSARGPLIKLRLRGDRLWTLRKPGHKAEIFDIADPAAPSRLGRIQHVAREEFFARYRGPHRLTLDGPRVSRYRLVPVAP